MRNVQSLINSQVDINRAVFEHNQERNNLSHYTEGESKEYVFDCARCAIAALKQFLEGNHQPLTKKKKHGKG